MRTKLTVSIKLLALCWAILPQAHAASVSGSVKEIWADSPSYFGDSGDIWVTLSNNPTQWVLSRQPYISEALSVFKATDFGNSAGQSLLYLDTNLINNAEVVWRLWMHNGGAANTVNHLFAISGQGFPYMSVIINSSQNGVGGLVTSRSQAAIAATSLALQQPVNWQKGCVIVYNTLTNMLEQNCEVLEYIALQ